MHARWLALPLAALTGCATAPTTSVRLVPADLQVGSMAHRTSFELDDSASRSTAQSESDISVHDHDHGDDDKKKRRRKTLFLLGTGAGAFGVLGVVGFGVGGRIVQAQVAKGFDEGTLTHEREDQLTLRGEVMNGMAIGSAVVGLAGVILAATVYGIDHARCGDLPPRRKHCPNRDERGSDGGSGAEPSSAPGSSPAATSPGSSPDASPPGSGPDASSPQSSPDASSPAPSPGSNPAASSPGSSPAAEPAVGPKAPPAKAQ